MAQQTAKAVTLLEGDTEAFARRTDSEDVVELVIVDESGVHRPVKVALHPQSTKVREAA